MNTVVKVDEKIVAMQAFVKIAEKYYKGKGVNRDPKAIKKIKKALLKPEHFCRLDINPKKVYKNYSNLDMAIDTDIKDFDPLHDIDVDQFEKDIITAHEEIEKFDDMPSVSAGRFLDMIFDKTIGLYKEGIENFAPERDDKYFMDVLDRELEVYKPCNKDGANSTDNSYPVENVKKELVEAVKNEILSEITQELPNAFQKVMYANIKKK